MRVFEREIDRKRSGDRKKSNVLFLFLFFFVLFFPFENNSFFHLSQARNKEQEAEVLTWIENVLGEKLPPGNYEDILKDGVVLCKLINKLAPGSVKKIQTKGTNFQLMENVQR